MFWKWCAIIFCTALTAIAFPQQNKVVPSDSKPRLVEVVRLYGDQYSGFTQSCLVLYADGQYHTEMRHQGPLFAAEAWQSPKAFDGTLKPEDLEKLKAIFTSSEFQGIQGAIGDPELLQLHLMSTPTGARPHADIGIFGASIARKSAPQVFEILSGDTRPRLAKPLNAFVSWVAEIEKRHGSKSDNQAFRNCGPISPSARATADVAHEPATRLWPGAASSAEGKPRASNAKSEREVWVKIIVNMDGTVGQASIFRSAGQELDQKALAMVKGWKFSPARIYGIFIPSPVIMVLEAADLGQ